MLEWIQTAAELFIPGSTLLLPPIAGGGSWCCGCSHSDCIDGTPPSTLDVLLPANVLSDGTCTECEDAINEGQFTLSNNTTPTTSSPNTSCRRHASQTDFNKPESYHYYGDNVGTCDDTVGPFWRLSADACCCEGATLSEKCQLIVQLYIWHDSGLFLQQRVWTWIKVNDGDFPLDLTGSFSFDCPIATVDYYDDCGPKAGTHCDNGSNTDDCTVLAT